MKEIKLIGCLCLLFFLLGCNKVEQNIADMEGKIKEIRNSENKTICVNTYNYNGTLKESWCVQDYFSPNEKQEYKYFYNSEKKLIRKKGYEPGIIYMSSLSGALGKNVDCTYKYNSEGRIEQIRIDYDYGAKYNMNYSKQTTFQYYENLVVTAVTDIINPLTNSVSGYLDYHFNSNGNIEKTIRYNKVSETENRISDETVFTYDSKKAPFEPEQGPVSENNILSKTITAFNYDENGNQSIAYTSIFSYEYTYTADGYPESQIETYPNETKITKYFKY